MVDILILNGFIVTMDSQRKIIEDGGVAIEEDRIIDVDSSMELKSRYNANRTIDAGNMIVMPGLIDGHSHAGHGLIKGLGIHTRPSMWGTVCGKVYAEGSTENFWYTEALLTALERLKFGVTCSVDYLGGGAMVMRVDDSVYGDRHCEAIQKVGIRELMAVGPRRPPFPSKYSRWDGDKRRDYLVSFEEQLKNCETLIRRWHGKGEGRVDIAVMFPAPQPERERISNSILQDLIEMSQATRAISKENNLIFTMDGANSGTIKLLHEDLDLLGPDALLTHALDLTSEEIKICKSTNTKIVHNVSSRTSCWGRCPVPELIDAGVTVILGSDATGPDTSHDMFRHMFHCMHYHRRFYQDTSYMPPGKVLEMTTIDSAKALGMEKEIGSLEPGKKADVILVDIFKPHLYPPNMVVDRITSYANGNDVDTVIVDGEILMENNVVKTIDGT
jgi:cytosine/adenosine deaminase-related metal-dependent hydrolase